MRRWSLVLALLLLSSLLLATAAYAKEIERTGTLWAKGAGVAVLRGGGEVTIQGRGVGLVIVTGAETLTAQGDGSADVRGQDRVHRPREGHSLLPRPRGLHHKWPSGVVEPPGRLAGTGSGRVKPTSLSLPGGSALEALPPLLWGCHRGEGVG